MRASWVTIKHNKKLGRDQVRVAGLGSVQKTVYISIYIYMPTYTYICMDISQCLITLWKQMFPFLPMNEMFHIWAGVLFPSAPHE